MTAAIGIVGSPTRSPRASSTAATPSQIAAGRKWSQRRRPTAVSARTVSSTQR